MKNIYALPTDKSSRLYLGKNGNFVFGMMQTSVQSKNDHFCNQHIYITSDKEINDGDWVIKISSLYKGGGSIQKFSFIDRQFKDITFKKVILTTDQDLIQDNVQAIDDEFLEWFVKNPSCEWVEVEKFHGINTCIAEINYISGDGSSKWGGYTDLRDYKIIIPKEEPKQPYKNLNYGGGFTEEDIKRVSEKHTSQETLEEAAERYLENWEEITGLDYENTIPSEINKLDFINGATSNAAKQYWYKQFEKQKLEFAIEQIKDIDKKCFGGSNTCKAKIKELEQKLSEL